MEIQITTVGAMIGLVIAIILIIKKVEPAYSMIAGALAGGLIGGAGISGTVDCMVSGAQSIMPAIIRIVTSGVLAGILIQSGAAIRIAVAEQFHLELSSLMAANILPAAAGLIGTVVICGLLNRKHTDFSADSSNSAVYVNTDTMGLPSLWSSLAGPIIVVVLLMLRPVCRITIDPLVALPAGGIAGLLCMGKIKQIKPYIAYGLNKMMPVAILLMGTGTISGIIKASQLQADMTGILTAVNMPAFLLAPISGIIMAGATASSSAGATIASSTFGMAITQAVSPLAGGAMLHAGTIMLDSLPHGSIFHASAGAMDMPIGERLKLLPIDILEGFIVVAASTALYGLILT